MALTIRHESSSDIWTIHKLTEAAFLNAPHAAHTEQFIVDALRKAGALSISLVAENESGIVGHVAISPVSVSDGTSGLYGLGPISVLPEFQRQGIGSRLVHNALEQLEGMKASGCVLVGNPNYYSRFGFRQEPGIIYPDFPSEYFQVILFAQSLPQGIVKFHEAFNAQG